MRSSLNSKRWEPKVSFSYRLIFKISLLQDLGFQVKFPLNLLKVITPLTQRSILGLCQQSRLGIGIISQQKSFAKALILI